MLIEHLVSVGRRSAVERVAHCLLELRQRLQLVGLASETEFQCPLTQYDLADALGLSPIHVNRVLRQLREQDLLTLKSHTAIFHNIAGLIRLSGYDNGYLDHAADRAPSSARMRAAHDFIRVPISRHPRAAVAVSWRPWEWAGYF